MIHLSLRLSSLAPLLVLGAFLALPATLSADPLTRAKVTQTVNDVKISSASGANARPAKRGSQFAIPELLRTGANSRAELIAPDKTVTRVGSNTVFSFKKSKRGINLQQGSVLFHSPTGKGGGEVKTASATASVLGTTIIVAATSNGGFKFMVLEGLGKVIMPNGSEREIKAGNLTFIMPGANNIPQIFEFRLAAQTAGSALINGFNNSEGPVQSFLQKVSQQTETQEKEIASGGKEGTSLKIGDAIGDDIEIVDADSRTAVFEGIVAQEIISEEEEQPIIVNPFDPEECPNAYAAFENLLLPANITTPQLSGSRVTTFNDPQELIKFLTTLGIIDSSSTNVDPSQLFTASVLDFNTPSINLSDNYPNFAFISAGSMTFHQLLDVTSLPANGSLVFASGGLLLMANGSGILADTGYLEFKSSTGIWIAGSDLTNQGGGISLDTSGSTLISDSVFNFYSGTMSPSMPSINGFDLKADGVIEIVNTNFFELGSGSSLFQIEGGDQITLENVLIDVGSQVFISNNFSSSSAPGKDVFLTDTIVQTTQGFSGTARRDYTIVGTAANKSKGEVQHFYDVIAQDGKLTISWHRITADDSILEGYLDVMLNNLDIQLNDTFDSLNNALRAESVMGDLYIVGGNHGLASSVVNGPTHTYMYNAFNGNIRVNETGAQWTNFGSNDFSGGFSEFQFMADQANGTVHMRNANFLANVSNVSMQARTVNLENVNFSSGNIVHLTSQLGMVNFGSSMQGYVNFINNVFHGLNPSSDLSNPTNYSNFQSTYPGVINVNSIGGSF